VGFVAGCSAGRCSFARGVLQPISPLRLRPVLGQPRARPVQVLRKEGDNINGTQHMPHLFPKVRSPRATLRSSHCRQPSFGKTPHIVIHFVRFRSYPGGPNDPCPLAGRFPHRHTFCQISIIPWRPNWPMPSRRQFATSSYILSDFDHTLEPQPHPARRASGEAWPSSWRSRKAGAWEARQNQAVQGLRMEGDNGKPSASRTSSLKVRGPGAAL
jgi:hypothetical protein